VCCLLVATRGLCACLVASAALVAHAAPSPQESSGKWRLLNRAEGRDIASVARGQDEPVADAQDCSHLVHEIYARAGYEYPYASSYGLYAGNENFERVKNPQPGDLVVWRGHVGIVLDPKQHSFYSQVSSGPDAQDYTGAYWRSRGKPRFYRYIVEDSAIVTSAKTRSRAPQKPEKLSSKAGINRDAEKESRDAKLAPLDAAERSPIPALAGTTASGEALPTNDVPATIVIASTLKRPTKDEVAAGITEWSKSAGDSLRTVQPLKVQTPVVIYEHVAVERVRIKGDTGSADVRVDSGVLLTNEGADFKQRHEKVRWQLRRTETGWIAVAPIERAYVQRDVAVQIFAAQLAHLAESDAAAAHDENVLGQEARLANLLSGLLQNR
jgi:hypothetical protein